MNHVPFLTKTGFGGFFVSALVGFCLIAGSPARGESQPFQYALDRSAEFQQSGQSFQALWWLRRASDHAQTHAQVETLRQQFADVRQANPLSLDLRFSVAPSDNINGGSRESEFYLGPYRFFFPPEQMALSGIEYAAEVNAGYRLRQTDAALTALQLQVFARSYSLSAAAQTQAPDVRGSDYSLVNAGLSLVHRFATPQFPGTTEIRLGTGKQWQGGQLTFDFGRIALTQTAYISDTARLALSFQAEHRHSGLRRALDADVYSLTARYQQELPSRDRIALSLSGTLHDSERESKTYRQYQASARYIWADPIRGAGLSLHADIGRKEYDSFSISLDGRRDNSYGLGLRAVFYDMTHFGFAPEIKAAARRTHSNVTRYDTSDLQISVGFTSVF